MAIVYSKWLEPRVEFRGSTAWYFDGRGILVTLEKGEACKGATTYGRSALVVKWQSDYSVNSHNESLMKWLTSSYF